MFGCLKIPTQRPPLQAARLKKCRTTPFPSDNRYSTPAFQIQKNSSILNNLKNMATFPVLSSSTSILAPNSCSEVIFRSTTAENNAKGPAAPISASSAVAEESIRGLMFPGCGTGIAKVTFRVAGGREVRSYRRAFSECRVRLLNSLGTRRGITYGGGDVESKQMRRIQNVILGETRFYRGQRRDDEERVLEWKLLVTDCDA